MAAPVSVACIGSKSSTKKYSISDVIEAIHASDSEFDELSSDDELDDEWCEPDDNYVSTNKESDSDAGSDDLDSSDDEPLASIAKKKPEAGQTSGTKTKKTNYKFNMRRQFIPPSDLEFVDVTFEPEPTDDTPYEYFKRFVTNDMFEYLAIESSKYAHQKAGVNLQTSANELETFFGLYFHMGLVNMPAVGCFWENDTRYPPVADVMSRNRFQKIASNLHIKDNLLVTEAEKEDKAWKIRPWFDYLNSNFATVSPPENQCVDEIMIAFKGRSYMKQYMPNKPKKWGFKLWARCSSTGFLHVFDIYQGKGTGRDDDDDISECGLGGNVVLKMCSSLPENKNFKVFADNYFSNLPMVSALKKQNLYYVGTIRNNRLHGAPLKSEKELKKEGRGAYHSVVETTNNLSLVRWLDNKCVTVVSSYLGAEPADSVQRYDRSKKEHISVDRPHPIGVYNKAMGGVDLMDMMCTLYKYQLRSKRWYIYIFYHTLTIALVNAWFLYKRDCKILNTPKPLPLRKFQAHVAAALCSAGKPSRGRPSLTSSAKKRKVEVNPAPVADVRFDGICHFPTYGEKRQRCRHCPGGFAYVKCEKCSVHLCLNKNRNCFLAYHCRSE